MGEDEDTRDDDTRVDPRPVPNPASQLGRLEQTGGTPESRRAVDDGKGNDGERWRQPHEESEPVERTASEDADEPA